MSVIYVVDTSYLLELYRVPGFSTPTHYPNVVAKVSSAVSSGGLLFLPLPCVIEFANHLADSSNKQRALEIGRSFGAEIALSLRNSGPWRVAPVREDLSLFHTTLTTFLGHHLLSGVGLCDVLTIDLARRLAADYQSLGYQVHIFTLDRALKAHEPNPEINPYVG